MQNMSLYGGVGGGNGASGGSNAAAAMYATHHGNHLVSGFLHLLHEHTAF